PCAVRLRLGRPHRLRRPGLSLREPRLPVVAALARGDRLSLYGGLRHTPAPPAVPPLARCSACRTLRVAARPCPSRGALALSLRDRGRTCGVRPASHRLRGSPARARLLCRS